MSKYYPVLLFFLISYFPLSSLGQNNSYQIKGQILREADQSPVQFATITLFDPSTEAATGGTTTDSEGNFTLTTNAENSLIKISFIGFKAQELNVSRPDGFELNLGKIALVSDEMTLDEVVIAGEQSSMEFQLDKRVFNVGQDLSSTGASAMEVLDNVPSVNVNIEGQISLRGSQGVQILINGKPSVLASEEGNALGTITADMIDRVEVITNPSAKYEAEGSSGIINIVLKKDQKRGLNGSASFNTGWPHNHSFGLSLNNRTEKFNLFTQLGAGYRELPNQVDNINQSLIDSTTLISSGEEFRNENFYNIILGTDYYLTPQDVFTLSGNFAYEIENQPSQTNFQFFNAQDELVAEWERREVTEATNPKYQYEFQYKRDFKDHKEHDLLFSALGNFFGKSQSSEFDNVSFLGDGFSGSQQTRTDFQEAKYTFMLDYIKPFNDQWTMEVGSQYLINDVSNDFAVSNLLGGEWIQDPGLTNIFDFNQKVLGVYATGAYEGARWGLKLGGRVENTDLETELILTGETNQRNFTNFFPSAHTSYKFNDFISLQAGYSRRVYRPRLWDLNPFFNIRNNFAVRTGNPNLQPEFTDSYEINSIYVLKDASFNLGVYHRYTTEVIERVSTFENGVNTTMPINLGTNRTTGVELNGKYEAARWLLLNGEFNLLYFNREGTFQNTSFDFAAGQWNTVLTAMLKLPIDVDLE
ncbi:MAG: outer membrane beta-barrel family protein, partial [Bacteroidota bacterium]